jgi:hypothetical protein
VHRDNQTVIAFGDVSGKGAAAALYGGLMSGLLRTLAPRHRRPAALLRAINEALIQRKVEARYATLTVLLWGPATRQIVMANAAAIPPMICRGNEILKLRGEGVPVGLLESGGGGRRHHSLFGRHHRPSESRRPRIRPRAPGAGGARGLPSAGGGSDRVDLRGVGSVQYYGVRRSDGVRDEGAVEKGAADPNRR